MDREDTMSEPYSIEAVHEMRTGVWATRDGCYGHYPRYCPPECPNAGTHDAVLAELGACECHQCRLTAMRGGITERTP